MLACIGYCKLCCFWTLRTAFEPFLPHSPVKMRLQVLGWLCVDGPGHLGLTLIDSIWSLYYIWLYRPNSMAQRRQEMFHPQIRDRSPSSPILGGSKLPTKTPLVEVFLIVVLGVLSFRTLNKARAARVRGSPFELYGYLQAILCCETRARVDDFPLCPIVSG